MSVAARSSCGCAAVLLLALASPARAEQILDAAVLGAVAAGVAAADRGELDAAEAILADAAARAPRSALVAREHALVLLRQGRLDEAWVRVDRAIALGDADPEVHELRALILAAQNEVDEAREAAARAGTWEGDLIGASLGDPSAAARASPWVDEQSPRGALAALTLAAHAGTNGERTTARSLAALAQGLARASDSGAVLEAARALDGRLGGGEDGGERLRIGGRVRASVDHATNPLYGAEGGAAKPRSLRASVLAEAAFQAPISTARLDAAVRFDQRMQLVDRERLDGLDLSGLSLAVSVEVPISARANAARVGLALRFHDLWGDGLDTHWATTFEGGPTLTLPLDVSTHAVLGVYGVGVDFIDRSPPDALVSSQNRDRIGQRAVATLLHDGGWLAVRADAAFLRDDAYGEAFDVRGGLLAGRIHAAVTEEIVLRTGAAVLVRSFGPVGDALVLGSAATRLELRVTAEIGAEVRLAEGYYLVVEDTWIRNTGRDEHDYTHNVLSLGLEARW